tara:strand:- start:347 stop:871 length:525 start_codon:yes stop_codon:yes gene_type:complete
MPFHTNKSSPRPARETKSDKKQQEKIRQREKDRQDRANQMAKSIRAKAVAAKQADKRKKEIEKAELAKQRQKDRDEAARQAKLNQQRAAAAKLKQEQATTRQNELDRIADYNRRRGIYQDAIAGMENPEVSPVVQKLLAQTIGAGTAGTVVARKRGGPVGYTKRWQDARKKSKT